MDMFLLYCVKEKRKFHHELVKSGGLGRLGSQMVEELRFKLLFLFLAEKDVGFITFIES